MLTKKTIKQVAKDLNKTIIVENGVVTILPIGSEIPQPTSNNRYRSLSYVSKTKSI